MSRLTQSRRQEHLPKGFRKDLSLPGTFGLRIRLYAITRDPFLLVTSRLIAGVIVSRMTIRLKMTFCANGGTTSTMS